MLALRASPTSSHGGCAARACKLCAARSRLWAWAPSTVMLPSCLAQVRCEKAARMPGGGGVQQPHSVLGGLRAMRVRDTHCGRVPSYSAPPPHSSRLIGCCGRVLLLRNPCAGKPAAHPQPPIISPSTISVHFVTLFSHLPPAAALTYYRQIACPMKSKFWSRMPKWWNDLVWSLHRC